MFISAAAPDPTLLGTTNGLAEMIISFTCALGPSGASASLTHSRHLRPTQWCLPPDRSGCTLLPFTAGEFEHEE
jgi:hypothetical protein